LLVAILLLPSTLNPSPLVKRNRQFFFENLFIFSVPDPLMLLAVLSILWRKDPLHQLCSIIVKQEINVNRSTLKMNELETAVQSIDKKLEVHKI
jgi:3-methyladenine DNA glycosylase/8-oxoguanine DNA glycosylase